MLMVNHLCGFGAGGDAYTPASMVFNGSDEYLVRTLSTSGPSSAIFTYSMWVKVGAYLDLGATRLGVLWQVINSPTNNAFVAGAIIDSNDDGSGNIFQISQDDGSADWGENGTLSPQIGTATWVHLVARYDSTQGTSDNRLRLYQNGTLITDAAVGAGEPGASETHAVFTNGRQHQIGAFADLSRFFNGKMAFIDVLDGVSADATAFAFDNGGTWTRMAYTGSRGTHGFSLDGSTGILGADVSGNGQTFTGTNMDNSNLDTADLPPWVN